MTTTDNTTPEAIVYEKGSWQESLQKSATLKERAGKANKSATNLLWAGAQTGIEEWLPTSSTDVGGEGLAAQVLTILGASRKGDASKIKTVALAVKNNGLNMGAFDSLTKAYGEARRLTQTVVAEANEDDAAEAAVEALAAEAPKTASTPEAAAKVLLVKGIDGAVVALLDALGATNFDAHRSFMRAVSTEVSARVQAAKPKPAPKSTAPKAGATKAKSGGTAAKKAAPKAASTKAKPASTKASPAKAAPVDDSADKGEVVDAPVPAGDATGTDVPTPKAKRAVPVKRPAK